jgi:hypothetical protein
MSNDARKKILEGKLINAADTLTTSYLNLILESSKIIEFQLSIKLQKDLKPFFDIILENAKDLKYVAINECKKRFQ